MSLPIPRASGLIFAGPNVIRTIFQYFRHGSPHPKWSLKDLIVVTLFKTFLSGRLSPPNDQSNMSTRLSLAFDDRVEVRRAVAEVLEDGYYEGLTHPSVPPAQVPLFYLTPKFKKAKDDKIVMYVHGGGYKFGNATAGGIASMFARRSGREVCTIDYRLGPTAPFPAALQDCVTAYFHLLQSHPAHRILIAGDSAGGGLVVALLVYLRNIGSRELPGSAVLFSPYLQTRDTSGDSYSRFDRTDFITAPELVDVTREYTSLVGDSKYIQLLGNTFEGLPPLFVAYGSAEIFRDDDKEFCRRAREDGVEVLEYVGDGKTHVWIAFPWDKKDVNDAWKEIVRFVDGGSSKL